jgi:glycosyltransferase involved in cell wall biosynthesis
LVRLPLTVTILTKNEAVIIRRCIDSVSWADEVLVLDSESADQTCEIARQAGATVYTQKWLGWLRQHERAIELARSDWILVLDADEIVSPQLANSIQKVLADKPDPKTGFVVDRRDAMFGKLLPKTRSSANAKTFVRLFNRKHSHYDQKLLIHEKILSPGRKIMLSGVLIHWRSTEFATQSRKDVENAILEADLLHEAGVRARWYHLIFWPTARFMWCYIWCGSIKLGTTGLLYSMFRAKGEFLRYAFLWEKQQPLPTINPPQAMLGPT